MKILRFGFSAFAVICFWSHCVVFAKDYTPPQTAISKINSYRSYSELTNAANGMDIDQYTYNMTTWQIANGGFYKALNFLLTMQRANGGIPQVWPKRGNYSDQITLNDNAMIRAMVLMMDFANSASPFDSDIIDEATRGKMSSAQNKAVDFLLKAQIVNNGTPTVWCAQHDTSSMAPVGARAYELASKSGSESAGTVWFLMNWPEQTAEIQKAVKSAIAWYKKTKVIGHYFKKKAGTFEQREGNELWYRFYEVNSDDYVPPPPPPTMCGTDTCKGFIQGEEFLEIVGVKEATSLPKPFPQAHRSWAQALTPFKFTTSKGTSSSVSVQILQTPFLKIWKKACT